MVSMNRLNVERRAQVIGCLVEGMSIRATVRVTGVAKKLVPTWLVGERTTEDCYTFLRDLRERLLPGQRIQLSTDGFGVYPAVVDALWRGNIDYGVIIKEYGDPSKEEQRRYSPATC